MLKRIILLLCLSQAVSGQIVQYDFNNTLAPTVGTATLTAGTINTVPTGFTTDRFGNPNAALSLTPGATDYSFLDMGTSDNIPVRTVCFWFKAYTISNTIRMMYEADGSHINFGQTQFGVINGTIDYLCSNVHASEPIVANKWYFAALSSTGTQVKFYLDCKLVHTGTITSNSHSAAAGYPNGRLGQPTTIQSEAFNYIGAMDEFRIYNTALTAAQLITVMGSATLNPVINMPSSFCAGAPITADASATTGTPINESNHFWEIIPCDQFGTLTPGAPVWSNWYPGEAGIFTFPTAANGGPNFLTCGGYYKVKLAVQTCQVVWAETAKVIKINCPPTFSAGPNQTLCPGGTVCVGAKTINPNLSFSWQPTTWLTNPISSKPCLSIPTGYTTACPGSTTYTLTTTDVSTGCSNTSTTSVSYTTSPTVATITENKTSGCINNSANCNKAITLTASTCPGVSYSWSDGVNPSVNGNVITAFPESWTWSNYTLTTTNSCFTNSQSYGVQQCFKPSSFPGLFIPTGVIVNWSGNYGPGGFWVYDNAIPHGTGPAYGATHIIVRVFNRWGTQIYQQEACAPCGGFWNGYFGWNCVLNGQPLPVDSYTYEVIRDNCSGRTSTSGSFSVIGHMRVLQPGGITSEEVQIDDVTYNTKSELIGSMEDDVDIKAGATMSVFPNPGHDVFTVSIENSYENCTLEVTDVLGNKILSNSFSSGITFDLSTLANGIYIVKVKCGNQLLTKKVIKN